MLVKILKIKPRGNYTVLYVDFPPYTLSQEKYFPRRFNIKVTNEFAASYSVGDTVVFDLTQEEFIEATTFS